MNGDDPIVRGEDFLAEIDRRGAGACPSCGYVGMVTFGLGGELEPLFLLTKSQIRGELQSVDTDDPAVLGKTVYALTCDNCGFLSLWDTSTFGGSSGAET
jgi:hypothetical protein